MLKKRIVKMLFIFFLILGIQHIVYGAEGTITGETVKLREGASLEAKLVTLLSVNDKVEVIEKEGDWYKVKIDGKTGYVFAQYVKVEGEISDKKDTSSNVEEKPQENTVPEEKVGEPETLPEENKNEKDTIQYPIQMTLQEKVDLKILPLLQATTIIPLEKDTKVTATQEINGWVSITTDSAFGWIRIEKLQQIQEEDKELEIPEETKPEETPETPKKEETKKTGFVNVDTVNLRKEANTDCEVVANLNLNTEVTILEEKNNWSKVEAKGKTGYIASKYLSDKKTEVTNRSGVDRTQNSTTTEEPKEDTTVKEPDTDVATEVVSYAKSFLGVPYISGGSTPKGFDCSGFTKYVYQHFGKTLSRNTTGQAKNGVEVSKANLQLGDLVVFRNGSNTAIGHVGIYIGGGSFIHASSPGDVVKITALSNSYYSARYVTARRIL